jgi:hypothetical protein
VEHFENKLISNISNLNFVGTVISNILSRKNYVDMITTKLSAGCFVFRALNLLGHRKPWRLSIPVFTLS